MVLIKYVDLLSKVQATMVVWTNNVIDMHCTFDILQNYIFIYYLFVNQQNPKEVLTLILD